MNRRHTQQIAHIFATVLQYITCSDHEDIIYSPENVRPVDSENME